MARSISLFFDLPDHAKNSRPRFAAVAGHDEVGKRSSGIDADEEVLLSCHEILSEIALQAELCKGVPDVKDASGQSKKDYRAYLLMERPEGVKLIDEPANLIRRSYGRQDDLSESL